MLAERFQPPFYSWIDFDRYFKAQGKESGILESASKIADIWNTQGPFDGLLGFS